MRERGFRGSRLLRDLMLVGMAVWVCTGCASSTVTFVDEGGDPIVVEQKMGGRGCIAMSTNKGGGVDVVVHVFDHEPINAVVRKRASFVTRACDNGLHGFRAARRAGQRSHVDHADDGLGFLEQCAHVSRAPKSSAIAAESVAVWRRSSSDWRIWRRCCDGS